MRENGISGTVGQAADAVSQRTNSAVAEAKKLPGFVNKQTEVALDRVEDAINQVSSWPIGKPLVYALPVFVLFAHYFVPCIIHATLQYIPDTVTEVISDHTMVPMLTHNGAHANKVSFCCSPEGVGTG